MILELILIPIIVISFGSLFLGRLDKSQGRKVQKGILVIGITAIIFIFLMDNLENTIMSQGFPRSKFATGLIADHFVTALPYLMISVAGLLSGLFLVFNGIKTWKKI